MAILHSFTPIVEPISLDEAFLDVSHAHRLHGSGPEIAASIRTRVRAETGLTASVGVAATKQLAKLASDSAKPDGMLVVEPGRELEFLHPLPVRRLWGVGPATMRRLARLGVTTVGDLAAVPVATLVATVGQSHGEHLHALAWNRDDRAVEPDRRVKSVGHEETFPTDISDRSVLEREVLRLSDKVAGRLRKSGHTARTVQLKLRYADFRTITRSRTLKESTDLAADLAAVARELLGNVDVREGVRLLGISGQQLEEVAAVQDHLPLDAGPGGARRARRRRAGRVGDRGAGAAGRARAVGRPGARALRRPGRRPGAARARAGSHRRDRQRHRAPAAGPRLSRPGRAVGPGDGPAPGERRVQRAPGLRENGVTEPRCERVGPVHEPIATRRADQCRSQRTNSGSCGRSRRTSRSPTRSSSSRSPTRRCTGTRRGW